MKILFSTLSGFVLGWLARQSLTPAAEPDVTAWQAENDRLRQQLTAREAEINRLQAQLETQTPAPATVVQKIVTPDDLKTINGIGPTFAKRLNEAGITTFAELAALSPDRLQEIVSAQNWQRIDPSAWIEQAKSLM